MNDNVKQDSQETLKGAGVRHEGQPDDLHDLIGSAAEGDTEDPLAEYRNDPNYAALIKDLEYIASVAKEYFLPEQEAPSDKLWTNIKTALSSEPKS